MNSPSKGSLFSLFRETFWRSAALPASSHESDQPVRNVASTSGESSSHRKPGLHHKALKALDLRALPRDEGPPTELRARRDKFAYFEQECTKVVDGLYLGADSVARNWDTLEAAGITHVVNCVGFIYPAYFEDRLSYKTLYLQDTPGEDITAVFYDTFDFLEAALKKNGRVLIHCSQGVSRSATLLIAFLMWRSDQAYDEVFQQVKASRGVANPNIGFICQLLNWHKRRHTPVEGCRLYRVGPQCSAAPTYLVLKAVLQPQLSSLDPRGVFAVQCTDHLYLWQGSKSPQAFHLAGHKAAAALACYESAPQPELVQQGQEPQPLLAALGGASDTDSWQPQTCAAYDEDFRIFSGAMEAEGSEQASAQTVGADMAQQAVEVGDASEEVEDRQGSLSSRRPKTPRCDGVLSPGPSPNARSRKIRKGAREKDEEEGQGNFWSYAPAPAPAPGPAPAVSMSDTVPTVSALVTLPSFTLQSFDTAAQAQFISRIKSAYPNNNVAVNINSVNAGSVVVNETTSFLDGDQAAANSNARDLATAPATIFPANTYGNVTTSGVSNGTAANPAVMPKAPSSGATTFAALSVSALAGAGCLLIFSL
ncbi:Protein-tyrosine-phosphatase mkp1 [Trebouxia sp. C0010 RCD-2024]